jgi:hypothetical protein
MCCKELRKQFTTDKERCFDEKLRAEEEGVVFIIESKEKCCRVQIDKGIVTDDNVKKCDYVFVRCKKPDFYYVELKSNYKEIEHAYEQIKITIHEHFPADLLPSEIHKKKRTYGFIIYAYKANHSKTPQTNQRLKVLKDKFKRECGESLQVERSPYIHKI